MVDRIARGDHNRKFQAWNTVTPQLMALMLAHAGRLAKFGA